jgi:predicted glycosyltransferase
MRYLARQLRTYTTDIGATPAPRRIAFYSHDTMGLGHIRRNLLIAQHLNRNIPNSSILLITGSQQADAMNLPSGIDRLILPSLYKESAGTYRARTLNVAINEILRLRTRTIRAALEAFRPDVLVVDNVPRGVMGELNPVLTWLRAQGRTRIVLGLRDILDDPATVQREWEKAQNESAIRNFYDHVWVYGDPNVWNPLTAYGFAPDVAAKMEMVGYLDQRERLRNFPPSLQASIESHLPDQPFVLCLVGGGQDGVEVATTFARAELPSDRMGLIVAGPHMATRHRDGLHEIAATRPNLKVLDYVAEPTLLLAKAERVVAMAGYNTTCEILSFGTPALLVPRVVPRREQQIRAEQLHALGALEWLHPADLSPDALSAWVRRPVSPRTTPLVWLDGLPNVAHRLSTFLAESPRITDWRLRNVG